MSLGIAGTAPQVYEKLSPSAENISVANLGGLYLGDRPKADPRFKFVPTRENIRAIPPLEEVGSCEAEPS